ncbi:MAG TPA: type III-B CRISPR module RAMP protein Cmr1, partial [Bacteroidetes bacterium]|nr:type III-B CRISPR module RAMP protein Cmr1 [Bacteroidota bacterium]
MEKITFTCETITPMFIAGADGKTPELRAPGIKGALRFWWRAVNGHLSLKELKKREAEIFGGTDPARRSRVVVRVLEKSKEKIKISNTPHHRNGYCKRGNTNCNFRGGQCTKAKERHAVLYNFDLIVCF